MLRTRLAGAALLTLTLMPGCGFFCGDRPGLFNRCANRGGGVSAMPISYPGPDAGCGATVIPPSGGMIYGAPGATVVPGDSYPLPPITTPPRIPKAGIDEGKGKQFELEGASRSGPAGPALPMPAIRPVN